MIILGIETSCDETAAAVVRGRGNKAAVLSNIISSQINIHKRYGGVVPEVAAREHVLNILPVIKEALKKAKINDTKKIDVIAVTKGPGLVGSLMIGVETAKILSYAWNIPVVGVNHIEGHLYANFATSRIRTNLRANKSEFKMNFPALILTVSGGHTMLILMRGHGKYKIIGSTRDDAAGEAFDKAAAMLGLGYPGGPIISEKAEKAGKSDIKLPRPMIYMADYDFSFSGLKTALLYELKKDNKWNNKIPEYAEEFQQAIIDVLIHKTIKAANKFKVKTVMLAGGVAANKALRCQLKEAVAKASQSPDGRLRRGRVKFVMPDLKYTTDNAAMIAAAGYFRAQRKKFTVWEKLKADSGLEL